MSHLPLLLAPAIALSACGRDLRSSPRGLASASSAPSASAAPSPSLSPSSVLSGLGCEPTPRPDLCARLAVELGLPPDAAPATYALRPHGDAWEHVCEVPADASAAALEQAVSLALAPSPPGWGRSWSVARQTGCPMASLHIFGQEGRPLAYRIRIHSTAQGSYCGTSKPRLAICGAWGDQGELRLFSAGPEGRFELDRQEGTIRGSAEIDDDGNVLLRLPSGGTRCAKLDLGRLVLGKERPRSAANKPCPKAAECRGCPVLDRR